MERSQVYTLPDCTAVLCEHPAVREAIACRSSCDDQNVVAFVLAHQSYIDDVLGGRQTESNQIRKWRKIYDLAQLSKAAETSPVGFNIAGWKSSYTREPISAEDMREWVRTTVDRISVLEPMEVLEIGCGTGLLLLRIASRCRRYVALDFASSVLMRLKDQLTRTVGLRDKVEVLELPADNSELVADNLFDTVIINSVVQYFPSASYLDRVIKQSIRAIKPGGHLFVGDLRSLPLLETHACSIEAFQATPEVCAGELRNRIRRRILQEQELVLSPSYFLSLGQRFSKVSRVEIYPRRGNRDNEMTRFRYDAILWLGAESAQASEIPFRDLPADGWRLDEIRSLLSIEQPDAVGIAYIRNSRLDADVGLQARLATAYPLQTLGELRRDNNRREAHGIHPEAISRLAAEMGYNVVISWASAYSDGSYDAAFIRKCSPGDSAFPSIKWPRPASACFVEWANTPGQAEIREKLVDQLLSHCRYRLRGDLVPTSLRIVDSFPRQTDGSVDSSALLSSKHPGTPSFNP